jgi:hypothetical protein
MRRYFAWPALFACALLGAGCGRIFYEQLSEGADASAPDASTPDANGSDGGRSPDASSCVPSDCAGRCGDVDDGCGNLLRCGDCDVVQLSVTAIGTGVTVGPDFVDSAPAGIDRCETAAFPGQTCTALFMRGTVVTLTLQAGGSDNHTWGGDGAGCGPVVCEVTMDDARNVTVGVLRK